ncbi:MAG: protoporphyrinogen oxidase [Gammaproteobacteria bacterium]|jgi:oxygen-dependent protoporphyrinogen oxidase
MKKIAVVGGGISGLATAYQIDKRLRSTGVACELRVFEAEARTGGKIGAAQRDGFLCEAGPNGFLDSKPSTLELCRELGLEDRLLRARAAAARRFVFSQGELHQLPGSPPAFFRSRLLSLPARLRIIGELWAPVSAPGSDPTVAEFGRRRLGREAAARLLDPMVAGVYAGDPERLSLKSCFPRIAELEQDYRSLIRALITLQLKRGRRAEGGGPAGPGGTLTSFDAGLSVLPDTLAQSLAGKISCGSALAAVERTAAGYRLSFASGAEPYDCDLLVLATQAVDAVEPLRALDARLSEILASFEYAPVSVVGLGFEQGQLPNALDGFGFLVPGEERRQILGSLWTSSIFAHRAPPGCVLLRTLIGGARRPELALLPDTDLVELARRELAEILGIEVQPVFVQVFQWPKAICQYTVGHQERLQRLEARLSQLPGLYLTGNAYRGVALNDCTLNAVRVADDITARLAAAP